MSQFEIKRRYIYEDWAVMHKPTDTMIFAGDSVQAAYILGWMLLSEDLMNSVENMPIASADEQETTDDRTD